MTFGKSLKGWRKVKGMTQDELAKAVSVNVSYISNLERDFSANTKSGRPRASEDLCARLSKVLDVPLDTVRVEAGYAPGSPIDRHQLPEGVNIYFDSSSPLTDEEKDKLLDFIKTMVAGVRSGEGQ